VQLLAQQSVHGKVSGAPCDDQNREAAELEPPPCDMSNWLHMALFFRAQAYERMQVSSSSISGGRLLWVLQD